MDNIQEFHKLQTYILLQDDSVKVIDLLLALICCLI